MDRKRSIATIVRDVLREEDELDDDDDIRRRLSLLDSSLQEDEEESEEAMKRMEEEVNRRMQLLDNDLKVVDKEEIRTACKENFEATNQETPDSEGADKGSAAASDNKCVPETVLEDNENGESLDNSSMLDTQATPDSKIELSNTKVMMEIAAAIKLFTFNHKMSFWTSIKMGFVVYGQ